MILEMDDGKRYKLHEISCGEYITRTPTGETGDYNFLHAAFTRPSWKDEYGTEHEGYNEQYYTAISINKHYYVPKLIENGTK